MSELREAFEAWFFKEFPSFEGTKLARTETGYQGNFSDATYVAFKAGVEWKAQQAAVPSVPDGYVHVDEVKQLCRDYLSRTNNVYIKDVESALDYMAARAQEKVDV